MQYLCNKHDLGELYPTEPAQRAMVDSAMFYLIGTLARDYMTAIETALGEAYSEPAADVRGYVASMKSGVA
jgi:glutathione S-transferase